MRPNKVYNIRSRDYDSMSWNYHVHPEGQPYYIQEYGNRRFSYITELDVADPEVQKKLEQAMDAIEAKANKPELASRFPERSEVVLVFNDDEWAYYMVDAGQQRVFWLDEFEFTLDPEDGIEKRDHLRMYSAYCRVDSSD